MTRDEAWKLITSTNTHERLRAARTMARTARPEDLAKLAGLLAKENDSYIVAALTQAVTRAKGEPSALEARPVVDDVEDEEISKELRALVIEQTTKQLLHELRPLVAGARYHSKKEIPEYDDSQTRVQLDRLAKLLDTFDDFSRASSSPTIQDFDLAGMIKSIAEDVKRGHDVEIAYAGPDPFVVHGDDTMLGIVVSNGLRNAIEATEARGGDEPEGVVVNWNVTDVEYWVAILDRGPGPPYGFNRAFDIGSTTKEGDNLGMGLASAKRAIESLSGSIALMPRSEAGGARLEFRWPRTELE